MMGNKLHFLEFCRIVQPPTQSPSGKDNIEIAWWLSAFPGLAILVTVLGYNLLGEGIRDALDPRQRE